ncbi:MAG: DUF2630 family protein [Propionibacteriales bacterium]|nr:DUF2630 family protein [Propionibacteriales bacterium]
MASDEDVLGRIHALVEEEHQLRTRRENDELDGDAEQQRLQALEVELDRCWDLLRQRRALRDAGQDPDAASARPGEQVEGYLG